MKRAVVVGSGPNGLSAAITLARAGVRVTVLEAAGTMGGAARTEQLTLPGFWHDVGSSVYPMGISSPFFRSLPLGEFGARWVQPGAPMAHPLDGGSAVMLERSVMETAEGLGREDGAVYERWMRPLVDGWEDLAGELLGPVVHLPRHPLLLAWMGAGAVMPATVLGRTMFRGERARALFAGNAAHGVRPLESAVSAAVGVVLGVVGHAEGWPVVEGGAGALTGALTGYLGSLGGVMRTGVRVTGVEHVAGGLRVMGEAAGESFEDTAEVVMGDVSPRALVAMAGEGMASGNRRLMERYAYGPGAFKVDWALSEPIPWRARECLRAATVHVGGGAEEIAASERAPWEGRVSERPFVLVTQPSLFDGTRAPAGGHTAWGYCHVPNGWQGDATEWIERQMERFAPGFRECVVGRHAMGTQAMETWNANLVGGDFSGGAMTPLQTVMRPTPRLYETSVEGLFLCSSSTPPGGGVHGMCGYLAGIKAVGYLEGLRGSR